MILVTGGTGLVGSHILHDLTKQGEKVRAIYRDSKTIEEVDKLFAFYQCPQAQKELIEWVKADLSDYYALEDALAGISFVIHAAAMVSFKPGDSQEMIQTNSLGTAHLVNACLNQKIDKLCYISSIASLGKQINGDLIDEKVEWLPDDNRSAYSHSKFRAEMEVWRASKEGLDVVIVNPSVIIGPVNWLRSSGKLFYSVKKGMPFYTTGATGFVDVRDVSQCVIKLMKSDVRNERFILNGENISFKKLFTQIAKGMNKRAPFIKVNKVITEIGWRLNALLCFLLGKKPAITKDTARTAHSISRYSNQKIKEQTNHQFHTISDAIENTLKWFEFIDTKK